MRNKIFKSFIKYRFSILVLFVFIVSLAVRLADVNSLPHDAHPMRQTDTACVIHFFRTQGLNILQPHACLIRPPTNTVGLFFLEFPLYQWIVAVFQLIIGTDSWWSVRIINLLFFTIAFWALYSGTARFFNKRFGLWAAFIFSWLPSGIFFFGQAVHPDVLMIATLFISWNFLTLFLDKNQKKFFSYYLISMSLLIAIRPFTALALIPFSYLIFKKFNKKLAFIGFVTPFIFYLLWKIWQLNFPEADHTWQTWVLSGRSELLKMQTLKHLILKNLTGEVVGKVVSLLAFAGFIVSLLRKKFHTLGFVLIYLFLVPVYWLIVPAGNIAHQYYAHVVIFPFILLSAYFINWLLSNLKPKLLVVFMTGIISSLVIWNGYRTSRYFFINRISDSEVGMAEEIETTVPQGEKLVYLGQSSLPTSLAYRQGWIIAQPPADLARTAQAVTAVLDHANYVVIPNYDDSYPERELKIVLQDLELVQAGEHGSIYIKK